MRVIRHLPKVERHGHVDGDRIAVFPEAVEREKASRLRLEAGVFAVYPDRNTPGRPIGHPDAQPQFDTGGSAEDKGRLFFLRKGGLLTQGQPLPGQLSSLAMKRLT